MIEFEPHDYFTGKSDRKVSRELFQEHVRKTYDQIRELADYIEKYEGIIDTEFEKIVTHVNEQVNRLTDLYNDLLDNNILDSEIQEKLTQLEQNYAPRLSTLEQNDVSLTAQLQQTEQQLAHKPDKGDIGLTDLDKNQIQFDETWFADSVKQQWTGTTPVNATPPNFGVTTIKLAENAVTENKVAFVKESSNLFSPSTVTEGKNIDGFGEIIDSESYSITDFIEVQPSMSYFFYGMVSFAMYDENKTFKRRRDLLPTGQSHAVNNDTFYIRASFQHTVTAYAGSRQINTGTTKLPYEDWYRKVSPDVKATALDDDVVNRHNIIDGEVRVDSTNFLKASTNLFDVNVVNERENILGTGEVIRSESYNCSDYIDVVPKSDYSFHGFVNVSLFDKNKNFLRRVDLADVGFTKVTMSANAHYIRAAYQRLSAYPERRINRGTHLSPYEDFYTLFQDGFRFERLNEILTRNDRMMVDVPIEGVFGTSEVYEDFSTFNNTTSAEVYAMFDNLMAQYPTYITKEFLGNDSVGNPISVYYFTPALPETDIKTKIPKVFITCGVHGYEHASTMSTYLLLKQMCMKWGDYSLLEALRFNVNFVVIPVANPSGWNAYTRHNVNNVDLNRNFPSGWFTGANNGSAPLSELESQYIKKVFDDNQDIDIMFDFHNFHEGSDNRFLWVPAPNVYLQHMAQNLFSRMTRKWKKEFSFIPENYFAGYSNTGATGTVATYARSKGIKFASTFEICNIWVLDPNGKINDANVCKAGVEALGNWILINLRELMR